MDQFWIISVDHFSVDINNEHAEFKDLIEDISLSNAGIYFLKEKATFKTKVFFEYEDTENNYLIYAPFPKPPSRENHLVDTLKYSQEFFADKVSVIATDLGLDDTLRPIIKRHLNFFAAKNRTKKFYDLGIGDFNEENLVVAMMAVLSKVKFADFNQVLIELLSGDLNDNQVLKEFEKFDLLDPFWDLIFTKFGYNQDKSLENLVEALFITYIAQEIDHIPGEYTRFILTRRSNPVVFLDNLKNSLKYSWVFDQLSNVMEDYLEPLINTLTVDQAVNLDLFKIIDEKIITWIISHLEEENTFAVARGLSLIELCDLREKKHFGRTYTNEYHALKNAYRIIDARDFIPEEDAVTIVSSYVDGDHRIDTAYRKFYFYFDKVTDKEAFDSLRHKVEHIYVHQFLDPVNKAFSESLVSIESINSLFATYPYQKNFYNNIKRKYSRRVVVIISDAFRYELGEDLLVQLQRDKKFESANIEVQLGVVPSITSHGMAALLPHGNIVLSDTLNSALVDNRPSTTMSDRKKILQEDNPKADCISYKELNSMNKLQKREFFKEKELVYVYHNQVDARGDNASTEDEVLNACDEAISEIQELMVNLTDSVSIRDYVVTADYGFIYKRQALEDYNKIDITARGGIKNKRFYISDEKTEWLGLFNLEPSSRIDNYENATISTPKTSSIIKSMGAGQNYFHGGASIQEILIPIVSVSTARGAVKTELAQIGLQSSVSKITSMSFALDFIQKDPISDVILPSEYIVFFEDEAGNKISDSHVVIVDNKSDNVMDRIFKIHFNLIQRKYSIADKYYLRVKERSKNKDTWAKPFTIDIAFSGDFDFDI